MEVSQYTNCCTAKIFWGFGGTYAATQRAAATSERMFGYLKGTYLDSTFTRYNLVSMGIITAITNNEQKEANKFFRKMGFQHSKWYSKQQHADTQDRIWFIGGEELLKKLEEVAAMTPEQRKDFFK